MNQHWKQTSEHTLSVDLGCWCLMGGFPSILKLLCLFVVLKEFLMPGLIQQKKSMEN